MQSVDNTDSDISNSSKFYKICAMIGHDYIKILREEIDLNFISKHFPF